MRGSISMHTQTRNGLLSKDGGAYLTGKLLTLAAYTPDESFSLLPLMVEIEAQPSQLLP
jgi:hypothetical protein